VSAVLEVPESAQRARVLMRRGTAADVPALLALGRLMHREVHYGNFSEQKVADMIGWAVQNGIVLVSLSDEGDVVGSVGLVPEQPWYSDDWQLADRWIFVHPQFRTLGHAAALVRAARSTADMVGLPLLVAHIGTRAKGKTRLLARELGEPVGAVFFVRPRTGAPPPDLEV
jgi:GNAT superfamily N-acetyltransferase